MIKIAGNITKAAISKERSILFSENLLRGSRTVQFTVNVQKGILLQRRLRQERHTGMFSIIAG